MNIVLVYKLINIHLDITRAVERQLLEVMPGGVKMQQVYNLKFIDTG